MQEGKHLGTVLECIDMTVQKVHTFFVMPRGSRLAFENSFYHVFNRGANKQNIFLRNEDYAFFLKKLQKLYTKYDHSIVVYCLMPNHFHISLRTRNTPVKAGLVDGPLAYTYSSIREAFGKTPRFLLDNEQARLIGDTQGSLEEYKKYILDQDSMDFSDLEELFENEEVVIGTSLFATRAQRKYVKRYRKKKASNLD